MSPRVRVRQAGRIAVMALDAPPLNAPGPALRKALWKALEAAERDAATDAVLIGAAGRNFSAGPDLEAPAAEADEDPTLARLAARIEGFPKPVAAVLHGLALDGGLALALAARWRLAGAGARLGLAESGFGHIPGGGATLRLPRLVGAAEALEMLLTGATVTAERAAETGLVDAVLPEPLGEAALLFLEERLLENDLPPPPLTRPLDGAAVLAASRAARETIGAARLAAPARIVDCVEAAVLLPRDAAEAYAEVAVEEVAGTDAARALAHVLRAERRAMARDRTPAPAALGLIGTTPAGIALAARALARGIAVTLIARDGAAASEARDAVAAALGAGADTRAAMARLRVDADAAPLAGMALVAEALGSSPVAFAACLPALSPEAALVSLGGIEGARALAAETGAAERVLGLAVSSDGRLAELALLPGTGPGPLGLTRALAHALGWMVVPAHDAALGATVAGAGRQAAAALAAQGVAPARLDAALSDWGLPAGWARLDPRPGTLAMPGDEIADRVLFAMANAGARLLSARAAQRPEHIDLAAIHGEALPRWRGGPMQAVDARGVLAAERALSRLAEEDGGALWAPDPLWAELVKNGRCLGDLNRA